MGTDARRMFINGKWVLAEGGASFDVINPADQSVVATVTNGAVPEVEQAVAAADAAFREWSVLAPKDRGRFLLAIQELMEERRDELARLVTLENGILHARHGPGGARGRAAGVRARRRQRLRGVYP